MKKRVNRSVVISVLVLCLFLLVSCGGIVPAGEKPQDTAASIKAVQTGTQGITLDFVSNSPPSLIYDQNELVAIVEIHNKGNHDLTAQECFIQVTGFDTNIIKGGLQTPRSCAENMAGLLEGKNLYNLQGGVNQLEFMSPNVMLPPGVFEYNPTLNFVTCYNYHTISNPQVCVDPLFYQVTSEQKNCLPTDVSMGGGQGAPVGISYVNVDMVGNKAVFEINVVNQGGGRVLSPYADIRTCGQASLRYEDLDKVGYSVQLSGGNLIDCKPRDGMVRLTNNNGKVVCSFSIPGTSAFLTPLMIDLDYGYVQSYQKTVKIIRTPQ
ncbi:hypothetical protein COY27_03205 [Candidatus Woesearchaeota archaeon CG_4_10_14_0_2_um_filter_33_13]|nr:MAG: hypothetical protein COY27_03205 [Candidatus Woesearchaeota archaeon CG_4_10_14_0_2_um_filter_33_13]